MEAEVEHPVVVFVRETTIVIKYRGARMSQMMPSRSSSDSTPICRCRVLYMGSAVPHITKDGLQGIQEPLRELYPEQGALGARGIDSWLSVWSNGLLLENVDENHKKVTRFFPIETLHYCAAVRYVLVPEKASNNPSTPRFLPLDSPFARTPNPNHPPLFAAILRRTTGIKVLECHAFICKREMAANALVRCCFHAYADSSYAKQIDEKTSLYGTLRTETDTIDRVEGWRQQNTTKNGSTMTLNSQNGTGHTNGNGNGNTGTLRSVDQMTIGDDLSVYNGDENHKVWAGMSANENIYGEANYSSSTMRSGKTSRPRQAMPPAPPPPPPLKEDKKKNKKELEKKKKKMGSREDLLPVANGGGAPLRHAQSVNNLNMRGNGMMRIPLPPQPIYSNGTLMRPNGYGPAPMVYMHHPTATLPPPGSKKRIIQHAGTFSHRPKNAMPPKNMPPHFIPVPPPHMMPMPGKKSKNFPQPIYAMEEPIYMPSARPLSPVASYQPGHFPHEAYLLQQYATMDTGKKKKKGKNKKNMPMAVPIPIPAPMVANGGLYMGPPPPPPAINGHGHPIDIPLSPIQNEDDADVGPSPENEEESPFNTGIYRKKGHLNERAFSYSIRQEHRSRSYGSLANLKFATPIPNGTSPGKEDAKKEREIMQMMQDLDLSGDELERSEVPRAVYESKRLAAVNANAAKLHR